MKYCHSCGTQLHDDAQFCSSCGVRQHVYDAPTQTPEQEQSAPESNSPAVDSISAPTEQPNGNRFKKAVDKIKAFENKHNVIVNAIMLACAFIVAMVALFAPVKVEAYDLGYSYIDLDGDTRVGTAVTVDQSIYQILGSVFYLNADNETKSKAQKEFFEARENAAREFNKWHSSHSDASNVEKYNKQTELTAKYMSDVNYFGRIFMYMSDEGAFESDLDTYINAIITVVLGYAVAILANIMAVMSIVQLIFAIINMAKKKPQTKLYKYFTTMLGLSTAALSLLCCAPMFKAGGSMLAIALLISLVFLACGVIGSLLKGTHFMLIIKRGVCALVALIGYFVLFTEVFAVINSQMRSQANVVSGYGLFEFWAAFKLVVNAGSADHMVEQIVGLLMSLLIAAFSVSFSCVVLKRSLRRLALGDEAKKTKYSGMALTAAIFATVVIILGLLSGDINDAVSADKNFEAVKWLCRGGIWVNLLFMLGVYIFGKVFLPHDKIKGKEQPTQELPPQEQPAQPEKEPPVQNSLMQSTQNTYKPFM